ncbi:MAG: glycosyltransferase family 4 protein [Chloroflexi bacterium]|nr:glycosyltransferase family 4 protein [Chloroflexota bacterium]
MINARTGRRIVFVGSFGLWHRGTIGYRTLPIAALLREGGHDARIVTVPWDAPSESFGSRVEHGVPVTRVPTARRWPTLADLAVASARAMRVVASLRPDVVVAIKPKAYGGLVLLAHAGHRDTVVDTDDWEGRGGWADADGSGWLRAAAITLHEIETLRRAGRVAAASRELVHLAEGAGVRPERVTYLPNRTWEGSAAWPRPGYPVIEDADILLYSRMLEVAELRTLDLIRTTVARRPATTFRIVGVGPTKGQALQRSVERYGLGSRVEIRATVAPELIPLELRRGRVALVLLDDTRINRARCSVKVLDLLLCGRPIVAERVGEVGSQIEAGRTGILVEPGATGAIVEHLVRLLEDPSARSALGGTAEDAARGHLRWRGARDKLLATFAGEAA